MVVYGGHFDGPIKLGVTLFWANHIIDVVAFAPPPTILGDLSKYWFQVLKFSPIFDELYFFNGFVRGKDHQHQCKISLCVTIHHTAYRL